VLGADEHIAVYRQDSAQPGVWVRVTNDNGIKTANLTWAFASKDLLDGHTYTYKARVEDHAGNAAPDSAPHTITLDTQAPLAPTRAPDLVPASDSGAHNDDDNTSDTTPTVTVFDVPADAQKIELLVDGRVVPAAYDPATKTLTPLGPLPDGTHELVYRFIDATGNTSATSPVLEVVIDTTRPSENLLAPDLDTDSDTGKSQTDDLTADSTPSIVIPPFSDPALIPRLVVDGQEVPASYDPQTRKLTPLQPLPDGPHEIQYLLEDPAGNQRQHARVLPGLVAPGH